MEKAERRRQSSSKSIKDRKERLLTWAEEYPIKLPNIPREKLMKDAYDSWYWYKYDDDYEYDDEVISSENDFIHRITINYVRHDLTKYEELLEEIKGKVGIGEAYECLKHRIIEAIENKYNLVMRYGD
jgi:hypothetical protein